MKNSNLVEITSNSSPQQIEIDFIQYKNATRIDLSLEISAIDEVNIVNCLSEQLFLVDCIEELSIIFNESCILDNINILMNGISKLNKLKRLSIKFEMNCYVGEKGLISMAKGLQPLSLLTDLQICIQKYNYINKNVINHFNNSLKCLSNLQKLYIQIEIYNNFSSDAFDALMEGIKSQANISDLTVDLDFSSINQQGIYLFSQVLQNLNNLVYLQIIFNCYRDSLVGIDQIFQALNIQKQIKKFIFKSSQPQKLKLSEIESLQNCLQNFENLEEFSIEGLIDYNQQEYQQYYYLILKSLQNAINLKSLELNVKNFNSISQQDIILFRGVLQKFKLLNYLNLDLEECFLSENQCIFQLLELLPNYKQLQTFYFKCDRTLSSDECTQFFQQIRHLQELETLSIDLSLKSNLRQEELLALGQSLQQIAKLKVLEIFLNDCQSNLNLENLFYSLQYLVNLESLNLNKPDDIKVQDLFQFADSLKNLQNLTYLNLSFSSLVEQKGDEWLLKLSYSLRQLTKLIDLQIYLYNIIIEEEQNQFYQSLSALKDLEYLNLNLQIIFQEQSGKQFGDSLKSLKYLKNFDLLLYGSCKLIDIYNIILGLQSDRLKSISLILYKLDDQQNSDHRYFFDAFSLIKNLESLSINVQDDQRYNDYYEIFYNSMMNLTNLTKINISLNQSLITYKGFQAMSNFFFKQHSLLYVDLNIGDVLENHNIDQCFTVFYKSIQTQKNLRLLNLQLRNQNGEAAQMVDLFCHLKNLRQLSIHMSSYQLQFGKTIKKSAQKEIVEINTYPKYLTQLSMYLMLPNKLYKQNFINAFQNIRYLKYLNYLYLSVCSQHKISNKEVVALGQSLQQIEQIDTIVLNFSSYCNLREESLTELAKGIKNQQLITSLYITIQYCKIDPVGFCSIVQAIRYLKHLQILSILVSSCGCLSEECFKLIGQSLSYLPDLLDLCIDFTDANNLINIEEGIIQIGNSFQFINKLQHLIIKLKISMNIGQKGGIAFGKGLSNLTKLQNIELLIGRLGNFSNEGGLELAKSLTQMENLYQLTLNIEINNGLHADLMHEFIQSINNLNNLMYTQITLSAAEHLTQSPIIKGSFLSLEGSPVCLFTFSNSVLETNFTFQLKSQTSEIVLNLQLDEDPIPNDIKYFTQIAISLPKNYKIQFVLSSINFHQPTFEMFSQQISQINTKSLILNIDQSRHLNDVIVDLFKNISQIKNLIDLQIILDQNDLNSKIALESLQQINKSNTVLKFNFELRQSTDISFSDFQNLIKQVCQIKNLKQLQFQVEGLVFDNNNNERSLFKLILKELPRLVELNISCQEFNNQE